MAELYPYKIEPQEQIEHLYRKKSSPKTTISKPESVSSDSDSLQLKLNSENILQGIIFSEVFGKPKGLRMRR